MRILSALIFILSTSSMAASAPYRLSVQALVDGEKKLGDVFALTLTLEVDKPYRLDMQSLLKAGRIGLHLHQSDVRVQHGWSWSTHRYSLLVPYQVISQSLSRSYVTLPALVFQLRQNEQSYPVVLEPFSVDIAAGLDLSERLAGERLALVGPRSVPQMKTGVWKVALVISCGLLLALLFSVFWQVAGRPWWQRYQRPFARACRALRRLPAQSTLESRLRILHGALDATAEQTVLSCDIPRFVECLPQFEVVAQELKQFFELSDRCFYAARPVGELSLDIEALLERCARLEAEA